MHKPWQDSHDSQYSCTVKKVTTPGSTAIPFGFLKTLSKLPSIASPNINTLRNILRTWLTQIWFNLCRQRNWLLNGNLHYLVFVLNLRDIYWLLHLWDHWDLRSVSFAVWVVHWNFGGSSSWHILISNPDPPVPQVRLPHLPLCFWACQYLRFWRPITEWKLMQDAKTRGSEHSNIEVFETSASTSLE